jgi:hypothetical protein
VVFDKNGTIGDLENHDTLVLINEKNILVKESKGIQTIPIKNFPQNEINKDKFVEMVSTFRFFALLLPYLVTLLVLVALLVANLLLGVIYIFIITGLLWLLGNFLTPKFKYTEVLRIGIHTLSLVILVQFLMSLVNLVLYLVKQDQTIGLEPIYYIFINLVFAAYILVYLTRETAE